MADENEEVRVAAIEAWTSGASELESADEKARTILMGLQIVTDKDQLESMVMLVDGDLSDFQKLDVLTQVIDGSNKVAAEVAREHYKFWTEEDYVDLQTAQKWLDAQAE